MMHKYLLIAALVLAGGCGCGGGRTGNVAFAGETLSLDGKKCSTSAECNHGEHCAKDHNGVGHCKN